MSLRGQGIELVGFPENVEFCFGEDLVLGDPGLQVFFNDVGGTQSDVTNSPLTTLIWLDASNNMMGSLCPLGNCKTVSLDINSPYYPQIGVPASYILCVNYQGFYCDYQVNVTQQSHTTTNLISYALISPPTGVVSSNLNGALLNICTGYKFDVNSSLGSITNPSILVNKLISNGSTVSETSFLSSNSFPINFSNSSINSGDQFNMYIACDEGCFKLSFSVVTYTYGNPAFIPFNPVAECSNGIDDDGDGQIDTGDPECISTDHSEYPNVINPQCSDGVDNDGDGFIDNALDYSCVDSNDNSEDDPVNVSGINCIALLPDKTYFTDHYGYDDWTFYENEMYPAGCNTDVSATLKSKTDFMPILKVEYLNNYTQIATKNARSIDQNNSLCISIPTDGFALANNPLSTAYPTLFEVDFGTCPIEYFNLVDLKFSFTNLGWGSAGLSTNFNICPNSAKAVTSPCNSILTIADNNSYITQSDKAIEYQIEGKLCGKKIPRKLFVFNAPKKYLTVRIAIINEKDDSANPNDTHWNTGTGLLGPSFATDLKLYLNNLFKQAIVEIDNVYIESIPFDIDFDLNNNGFLDIASITPNEMVTINPIANVSTFPSALNLVNIYIIKRFNGPVINLPNAANPNELNYNGLAHGYRSTPPYLFIFEDVIAASNPTTNLLHVIAHEIGHCLDLDHPELIHQPLPGGAISVVQDIGDYIYNDPENLMDYMGGEKLRRFQWQLIQTKLKPN